MQQLSVLTLALGCVLLTAAGQIALKMGVSNPTLVALLSSGNTFAFVTRAVVAPLVLLGLVLYAASTVLWLMVLARADVSYAFPLVSLGFVFTGLYAHFVLHEAMTVSRMAGILLIVVGVFFVSRSQS